MNTKIMGERNQGIVILGLDRAGKSVIMNYLISGNVLLDYKPTLSLDYSTIIINNLKYPFYDTPGQKTLRIYWEKILKISHFLIYVLDVSERSRFIESKEELIKVLKQPAYKDYSLFFLFNKMDLPQSLQNLPEAQSLLS